MNYVKNISRMLQVKMKDQKGQTMVEYALLAALIGVALIVGIQAFTTGIGGTFTDITTALQ